MALDTIGKIMVFPSDANKNQKRRLLNDIAPFLKGNICLKKCQVIFGSDFIQGNNDTAFHISEEKLHNRLNKVDQYAILVVKPNFSKKTILTAGQLMHSQEIDPKNICIGAMATITKNGIQYTIS